MTLKINTKKNIHSNMYDYAKKNNRCVPYEVFRQICEGLGLHPDNEACELLESCDTEWVQFPDEFILRSA